jgi:hypothetical protein
MKPHNKNGGWKMKGLISGVLVLGLALWPAIAGARGDDKGSNDKPTTASTSAPSTPTDTTTATPSTTAPAAKTNTKSASGTADAPVTESELQQLREMLEAQQAEIAALKEQLTAHAGNALPAVAGGAASGLATGTPSGSGASPSGVFTAAMPQADASGEKPSPLSVRIGTAEFTPGGYVEFMDTWRGTNVGSGIGTTFTNIPYNNATLLSSGLSENRISAQGSRLNMKVTAPAAGGEVLGYVETDFNGNSAGNLYATRNSATLRLRLYFADYTRGKWEILGGQAWSMLTPNRKGIDPLPQDEFGTLLLDSNNSIGLVSARQTQFRAVYHPTDRWALGFSAENPDPWNGTNLTYPSCFSGTATGCTTQLNQVDTGVASTSPASWPDFVLKIARDQSVGGKNWHFEAAGLLTTDKLYTPSSVNGTSSNNSQSRTGGGVSVNFDLELLHNFHLIANSFWSDGGGRYLYITGPNFVVAQNPTTLNFYPSLEHAGAGLAGFEWQVRPKFQLFSYYGGNYFSKNFSTDPNGGKLVGYGYAGSSNSQNREFQEISAGFNHSLWRNENYGALQVITQASYVTRSPWVAGTGPANAHTAMVYLDLRYVLP